MHEMISISTNAFGWPIYWYMCSILLSNGVWESRNTQLENCFAVKWKAPCYYEAPREPGFVRFKTDCKKARP